MIWLALYLYASGALLSFAAFQLLAESTGTTIRPVAGAIAVATWPLWWAAGLLAGMVKI